jgi:hypothetical protein
MNAAIGLQICPHCGCLSLARDDSDRLADGGVELCATCGYFAGANFHCDAPHCNYSYRWKEDPENLVDLRDKHGEPDITNTATAEAGLLSRVEAWIKACESDGFEFASFVLVGMDYKVHWLRGNPPGR